MCRWVSFSICSNIPTLPACGLVSSFLMFVFMFILFPFSCFFIDFAFASLHPAQRHGIQVIDSAAWASDGLMSGREAGKERREGVPSSCSYSTEGA